jgi:uncharacterized protein (DUF934 family)
MRIVTGQEPNPAGTLRPANTDDVLALAAEVKQAPMVLLDFPKWTDGRAYSQAVLLRGRLRYGGEIRARGDVLVDMLPLLRRCGFDSAQLRADQDPAHADRTLGLFPGHYQGDATGARPVFARHTA